MSYLFEALQQARRHAGNIEPAPWELPPISPDEQVREGAPSLNEPPLTPVGSAEKSLTTLRLDLRPKDRLVTLTDADSIGAEKFRLLASRVRQVQQQTSLRRLLITSSITDEGKSIIAANLAVSVAKHARKRTLLIDGDFRRKSVSAFFNCRSAVGLYEWLSRGGEVWPYTSHHPELPLWFAPAGSLPDGAKSPVEVEALSKALATLDAAFDLVIIDSPPVTVLADASIWLGAADACLLVVRRGRTQKKILDKTLASIKSTKLLGIVLNDFSDVTHSYYHQYYGNTSPQL